MKIKIKIGGGGRQARAARSRGALALVWAALIGGAVAGAPARAEASGVYWQTRDLLGDFFRTSERVSYRKIDVDGDLRARVERRLGYRLARSSYTIFVATTGGRVDGYALFDDELGEHLPITFAVKLSASGVVERQEIVAYREARGDEVRDASFRRQFAGKTSRDALRAGDDVQVVSGATISSRAMAVGVRRALVLLEESVLRVGGGELVSAARATGGVGTNTATR